MFIAIQDFIRRQGLWLLLLWTLREVMGVVWQEYRSSRMSWPYNSDTKAPQAMRVEATIAVLEFLLFGVSILSFLLWTSVVEQRRELVRLQSRPPGQVVEGEKPPTATSTSVKCLETTSTTARQSRSNSPRRPISEQATSEHSAANADRHTFTDSLTATLDEHILALERASMKLHIMGMAKNAQPNHTGSTLDSNLLGSSSKNNSKESVSRAMNQQALRLGTTTTSNNRASRTDGVLAMDQSLKGSGQRTKRQRSTVGPGRGPQGGTGGQNQSTKRPRTQTGRSGGNAPRERKQADRGQILGAKGNAGKNNRRKEQVSQPQNLARMFYQAGRGGLSSTAPQQHQPAPSFVFPRHSASQNPWSNGQIREPPMASGRFRNDCAYPQVLSSQQPRARLPFGQPMDQRFMSAPSWAHNNSWASLMNAPNHPDTFDYEARILSPVYHAPRTVPQTSMASQTSPSIASVTTSSTSTTRQGAKLISDLIESQYSSDTPSTSEESFEPSIEVEAPGTKPIVGHFRSKSIPKAFNIDLEQGVKPLNRVLTFPQGDESHICWRALEQPYCEEQCN